MAQFNSIDELANQLSSITSLIDRPQTVPESEPQNFTQRALDFQNIIAQHTRKVDPKIIKKRSQLPIYEKKDELMKLIERNQIVIVIGTTGCGKTTQIPQYLVEAGFAATGKIGCTQLRRVAAKDVARRVAKEYGCELGKEVGYSIRFEDKTEPITKIQFMTDGILLRECVYDRALSNFSVIILDESHERTVDTDILLAVLKHVTKSRHDLKLIISSATLDKAKFSTYFFNAPVFKIDSEIFPVEIVYSLREVADYVHEAAKVAIRINESEEKGDIMIFLTGESDIEECCDLLDEYIPLSIFPKLSVIPVYSALPWEEQKKMFNLTETGCRKVIVATNIAETSLTVTGVKYVIDSGYVKQNVYDFKRDIEVLRKILVSKAQATQRTGRAGRLGPGKCYRLYTKEKFEEGFESGIHPEINRSNLTNVVLLLKRMGFVNIFDIDFLDQPPKDLIIDGLEQLTLFQAIDVNGHITEMGKQMASFPLDPHLAKMLILSATELQCSEEMLTIVAMLSVNNLFFCPRKKRKLAQEKHMQFFTNNGDLVMQMEIYNKWIQNDCDYEWCRKNFLNFRNLQQADMIREQLEDLMKSREMKIVSCGSKKGLLLKCICAGFFQNLAMKKCHQMSRRNQTKYITMPKQEEVVIHRGSALFRTNPNWVVYQKIVKTSSTFMRDVTPIEIEWLKEFAPALELTS